MTHHLRVLWRWPPPQAATTTGATCARPAPDQNATISTTAAPTTAGAAIEGAVGVSGDGGFDATASSEVLDTSVADDPSVTGDTVSDDGCRWRGGGARAELDRAGRRSVEHRRRSW